MRRSNGVAAAGYSLRLYDRSASDKAIDHDYYRYHEEDMNQAATNMYNEEPEYPQDEENYRDRPKHDGILALSELHLASRKMFFQASHSRITV